MTLFAIYCRQLRNTIRLQYYKTFIPSNQSHHITESFDSSSIQLASGMYYMEVISYREIRFRQKLPDNSR